MIPKPTSDENLNKVEKIVISQENRQEILSELRAVL